LPTNKIYRPDIDGLRALAILAVLLFHLGFNTLSGGFVGVDIFFVISGFLITGIIKNNLENKSFSFAAFYENRMRRILPALIFISLCTVLAFLIVYSGKNEMKALQSSVKRVMLAIPNIYFYLNTGYFDPSAQTMPLLHTWSLGVEEQFYFIFPLIMWFCYKYTRKNTLRYMILLTIISFVASSILVFYFQQFTFFMLPTRAWELLFGSILALTMYTPKSQKNKRLLIYAGLLLILGPVFTYNTLFFYPFPGLMALAPCLGATFYLSGGINLSEDSFITKIFKYKFFVFIGLISYSLYLWHWPLILLYKSYYLVNELSLTEALTLLLISVSLSYLSWKFVENPFRKKVIFRKRKVLYPLVACSIGLCLILASTARSPFDNGNFYANSDATEIFSRSTLQQMWERDANDFAFLGDSHRGMWVNSIEKLARKHNLTYVDAVLAPQNITMKGLEGLGPSGMSSWKDFTQLVEKQSIRTVFLTYRWTYHVIGHETDESFDNEEMLYENGETKLSFGPALLEGLRDSVKTLISLGVEDIYIMNSIPETLFHVPSSASKLKARDFSLDEINQHIGESVADYKERTQVVREIFTQLEAEFPSVHILDLAPLMLNEKEQHYQAVTESITYYFDDDHLSLVGTAALEEIFLPAFSKMRQDKIENAK